MHQTPDTTASEQDPIRSILSDWVDNEDMQTVPEYGPTELRAFADIFDVINGTATREVYIRALTYIRNDLAREFVLEIALVQKDLVEHGIDNRGPDHYEYLQYLLTSAMTLTVWLDKNPI